MASEFCDPTNPGTRCSRKQMSVIAFIFEKCALYHEAQQLPYGARQWTQRIYKMTSGLIPSYKLRPCCLSVIRLGIFMRVAGEKD